jgi:hypothetical protein
MRPAIAVLLAAGGLLALSACGLNDVAPSPTATPTTAVTATSTPSSAVTPSSTVTPTSAVIPTTKPTQTTERRIITKTRAIPFGTSKVNDPSLAQGTTKVTTRGVAGVKTITYELTFTNGIQTGEKQIREVVTRITPAPASRLPATSTAREAAATARLMYKDPFA